MRIHEVMANLIFFSSSSSGNSQPQTHIFLIFPFEPKRRNALKKNVNIGDRHFDFAHFDTSFIEIRAELLKL